MVSEAAGEDGKSVGGESAANLESNIDTGAAEATEYGSF